MKTVVKVILFGALTVLLSIAAMANEPAKRWEPAGSKNKNLIIYKADRKFVGGKVEILSNGRLIGEQVLQKRKLLIDFDSMKLGSYVVRITKGELVTEFTYEKK
jgi:hypothetical protein